MATMQDYILSDFKDKRTWYYVIDDGEVFSVVTLDDFTLDGRYRENKEYRAADFEVAWKFTTFERACEVCDMLNNRKPAANG